MFIYHSPYTEDILLQAAKTVTLRRQKSTDPPSIGEQPNSTHGVPGVPGWPLLPPYFYYLTSVRVLMH